MVACIGMISPKRQEILLYLAISVLAVNSVNVIITEWRLYHTDLLNLLNKYTNHVLIESGKRYKTIPITYPMPISINYNKFCFSMFCN